MQISLRRKPEAKSWQKMFILSYVPRSVEHTSIYVKATRTSHGVAYKFQRFGFAQTVPNMEVN